jgi:hypothetical protein
MVEDLIKRLRLFHEMRAPIPSVPSIATEAADMIEQQADRLTALESERDALLAAAGKEAVAIAISTEKICEIAGKYDLGNPRLDALRGFVNEIIIVNGAEYAKSE